MSESTTRTFFQFASKSRRFMMGSTVPVTRVLPTLVTLFGLCIGMTALKFGFTGKIEGALLLIVIAAVIDGIDGRLARILDSSSKFGEEMDSLADLVNFGVAPAFILYFWELSQIKVFGWGLTMSFVLCIAIRLARFNSVWQETTQGRNKKDYFFTGIPAPAAGTLVLLPIMITLNIDEPQMIYDVMSNHYFLSIYVLILSTLTVSRIPTFSIKSLSIPSNLESVFIFLLGILVVSFLIKPWLTIPLLSFIYILSIPVSIFFHSRVQKNADHSQQQRNQSNNQ